MITVLAPASTANLGPGFDAVGVALDLWNELVVEEAGTFTVEIDGEGADELPRDHNHLALRTFALFAPVERYRFRLTNRVPLERGLGSSASAIALGLVAGAAVAGIDPSTDDLLASGAPLEGHVDNLGAVLHGGVCVSWNRNGAPHAKRIATTTPLVPVVVVPGERTSTAASRASLPASVGHADAAATAGAAAMLGAALVSGDAQLLRASFHDRLHEPYRAAEGSLLADLRRRLPESATLSGSGPSVVVWAEPERVEDVVAAAPDGTTALPLRVAERGAHVA